MNGVIQEGSNAVITPVTLWSSQSWIGPRTSLRLPAYREMAMPPEVSTLLAAISEGIRQSAVEVCGVQGSHSVLQLGARPGGQLLQNFLKHVTGMPRMSFLGPGTWGQFMRLCGLSPAFPNR